MFCATCGQPIVKGVNLCGACGSAPPEVKQEPAPPSRSAQPKQNVRGQASRYEVPEYGVPHCDFAWRGDGFTVSFEKMRPIMRPIIVSGIFLLLGPAILFFFGSGVIGFPIGYGLLGFVPLAVFVLATLMFGNKTTQIEVTRDAVRIDGKYFRREDFDGFSLASNGEFARLRYRYGTRGFFFGGEWKADEATEVASALNWHLRATPATHGQAHPSAAELRDARPKNYGFVSEQESKPGPKEF